MVLEKIALKNLSRQKRRSILLGGAIAFGMLILMSVNGLVGGILKSIENNFSGLAVGHIFFTDVEADEKGRIIYNIENDSIVMEALDSLKIERSGVAKRTMHQGTLVFGGENSVRGLSGVDWKEESQMAKNLEFVVGDAKDMENSNGILIPLSAAEKLQLIPQKTPPSQIQKEWASLDSETKLKREEEWNQKRNEAIGKVVGTSVIVSFLTVHGQQNLGEFRIHGVIKAQFDFYAYTSRKYLNGLIGLPDNAYNQLGVTLTQYSQINQVTKKLFDYLSDKIHLLPWDQVAGKSFDAIINQIQQKGIDKKITVLTNMNNELTSVSSIFEAVQMVALAFFFLLMVVIMIGITNTFRIVVYERTKEIGTMRALGMQRREVRNLFLMEALFLAFSGILSGILISGIVLTVVSQIQWDIIAELSFFLNKGRLQVSIDPMTIGITVIVVSLLTLLAAMIPARKAAKMEPALALRTQY